MSDTITSGKIRFLVGTEESNLPVLSENTIGNVYFLMNPDLNRGKIYYDSYINGTLRRTIMSNYVAYATEAASALTADSAGEFSSGATITLTGDVTGNATGTHGWEITTTIPNGSVENIQLTNSSITIAGTSLSLGSSISAADLRAALGLTQAMRFVGKATVPIEEGSTTDPEITGYDFSKAAIGDVILDSTAVKEYFWNSAWEMLGPEGTYKVFQDVVTDPTSSGILTGNSLEFISNISQNENGEITPIKKSIPEASASQIGIVGTGSQTFAGAKTFNGKISANGGLDVKSTGNAVLHTEGVSATVDYTNVYVDGGSNNNRPLVLQNGYGNIGIGNVVAPTEKVEVSGNVKASGFIGDVTGNASSATKLANTVKINGTDFDGSSNITTDYWGDAINLSINSTAGDSAVSVNGSENKALNIPKSISGFTNISSTTFTGNVTGNISGNADTATKLVDTVDAGGANRPVYFSDGLPVAVQESSNMLTGRNATYDNGTNKISIGIGADGNQKGIYDDTNNRWIAYVDSSNNTHFNGDLDGNAASATRLNISSTDNAVAKFDGTNGTIQDSAVIIDDSNNITSAGGITVGSSTNKNTNNKLDVEGKAIINTGSSSSTNSGLTVNNGVIEITNYNNTLKIGAQNSDTIHFASNSSKPFNFDNSINIDGDIIPASNNDESLGSSAKRWKKVYIGSSDTYGSSTKPIFWNAGVPTAVTSFDGTATSASKLTVSAGSASQPVYFENGVPVAITGTIENNAATASALTTTTAGSASQPVYFSGGVPVAITGTISNNALTADKVNQVLKFGSKTYDGSLEREITAADLHIIDAMSFMGTTLDDVTTTFKNTPIITIVGHSTTSTATSGSIVVYNKKQYYWDTFVNPNQWTYIDIGDGSSYKLVQDEYPSPSVSGSTYQFIDTIAQDKNGNITATKKSVREASTTQSGLINTGAQSFAGQKTFTGGVLFNSINAGYGTEGISFNTGSKITETASTGNLNLYGKNIIALRPNSNGADSNVGVNVVSTNFSPVVDDDMYLGTASNRWKEAYINEIHGNIEHATSAEKLDADGTWAWTNGSIYGPTAVMSLADVSVEVDAIPSASATASGIITTDTQEFLGEKTFKSYTHFNDNVIFNNAGNGVRFGSTTSYINGTDYTGNAATATKLKTARTLSINSVAGTTGVAFDGSADKALTIPSTMTGFASITSTAFVGNVTGNVSGSSGSCTGNAATATKLATARTLTIGSTAKSFDGSANVTWTLAELGAAASSHTHSYLPLSGGTMTGAIVPRVVGGSWYQPITNLAGTSGLYTDASGSTSSTYWPFYSLKFPNSTYSIGGERAGDMFGIFMYKNTRTQNGYDAGLYVSADTYFRCSTRLYGAVWNDYAEYRKAETIEAGRCVREDKSGEMKLTSERMMKGCEITSDTFGFAIGETETEKTPIAASGRVLAYTDKPREEFELGMPVCSGPNGTISQMTEEEARMNPWCIIGTVSEIPTYEEWGTGNVKVNNRIWIRIR